MHRQVRIATGLDHGQTLGDALKIFKKVGKRKNFLIVINTIRSTGYENNRIILFAHHAMSEAPSPPPPPPPLNLSSDKAVVTGHLQTFKLSILKECKEYKIVVPKKPAPKKVTYIKVLLTHYVIHSNTLFM
jgi:hypothetical protein